MNLGPGIIMDAVVILIVLLSTVWGARRGFALTVISFMQWFVCIILGFFLCAKVSSLLTDYTTLDDVLKTYILQRIDLTAEGGTSLDAVPDLFGSWMRDSSNTFAYGMASSIASVMLTVISFLLIVFGIKFLCFFLARFFSRKYHRGVVGFFDGFMGLLFGGIRGIILVFLTFAVLVPVLSLIWPDLSELVMKAIDDSYFAGFIYNDNFLLILVRDLFS